MSWVFIGLGWILLATNLFVWIGYSVYQVLKTNLGFFEIILPNIGYFALQAILGFTLLVVPLLTKGKEKI